MNASTAVLTGSLVALSAIEVLELRGFAVTVERTPARIATDDGAWADIVEVQHTLTHDDGTEIIVRTVEASQ